MIKPGFFISSFFVSLLLSSDFNLAQEIPERQIQQIVVVSNKKFFSDDQTTRTIDLKSLHHNDQYSIATVLEKYSPALIRNYGGAGTLTTLSLHGTGSNHTQVTWNGFPLNSPASGQIDLSLIPSGFMQSVDVISGASGALYGSGTFGGAVNLDNQPDWNSRIAVNYSLNTGSFGSIGHLATISAGGRRVQYQLSALTSRANNDFTYEDHYRYQSPQVKNQHNAYKTIGLVQNLYMKLSDNDHLETGLWYQHKTLEIPAIMGSYKPSFAQQKDSLFRSFLSYRKTAEKYALVVKSAYFSDFLNYTDKTKESDSVYSLYSKIAANRLMNEADYRIYLSSRLIIGGGVVFNRIMGKSSNYGGSVNENEYAVYGNLKFVIRNLIINAGLRKELYEGLNPQPQYSFGIRFKPNDRLLLRSGFSSKFRKPTFNEKYWNPGGNPQLRPEKGRGGEMAIEWNALGDKDNVFWLDARFSGYFQTVDNWIQWVMLTPVEYKKVRVAGMETWLEYGIQSGSLSVEGQVNYNFNRSMIVSTYNDDQLYERNQLMYIPVHTFKASSEAWYRNFMLGLFTSYTGMRETVETTDEQLRLPSFTLVNVLAGITLKTGKANLTMCFRIDNMFDTHYEVIRSYPLPGRTYHITIKMGLNKTSPYK